ncbi:MAG: flagellar hook-associated protein FlgK [Spirochaetaceae bacterium]|nr:MAG: flagellar hook-associated protein FlgK [Spirochaetaceae bacterium]
MLSTFTGIEMGKRGLLAHAQGFVTVGHNLANSSTEGYSRQRVIMTASDPIYLPGLNREMTKGHIGQGIEVERVERVRDILLEDAIIGETGRGGYWSGVDKYLLRLSQVYNEPVDIKNDMDMLNSPNQFTVRDLTNQFWSSWQDLADRPTEVSVREGVAKRGENLAEGLNHTYRRLREIRDMLDTDVIGTVGQINTYTKSIASLNEEIQQAIALGDNPNDLLDKRDLAVEKLGELIDIHVVRTDPDEFIVYTNGRHIVQGTIWRELDTEKNVDNEGYSRVIWKYSGEEAAFAAGKLKAYLDVRDIDARGEIQKLDVFAMNFTDLVNSVHRKGFGANGQTDLDFFQEVPFVTNVNGNYDRTGDGVFDSSYVFRLTGANALKGKDHIGVEGTMTFSGPEGDVAVNYFATDTVDDVIHRINFSGADVSAQLDESGRLVLKAVPSENTNTPDFVFRHAQDSGQFLVGYSGVLAQTGAAGAYDWQRADAVVSLAQDSSFATAPLAHPSGWIQVNPAISKDSSAVASAGGTNGESNGIGDGSIALSIAQLRTRQVTVGDALTVDEYFEELVASIGLRSEAAEKFNKMEQSILKNQHDMRQAISGVNINEELTEMIKYQHGYNASARIVTEFDKMLEVIINRLGV